jgi:DNA repair exonuclease SbcCD nuclease subunit
LGFFRREWSMRVAMTADVHLAPGDAYPERVEALEEIFRQLSDEGIEDLIIAGDLFDRHTRDYSDFEQICGHYAQIRKHLIPGNHDAGINGRNISCHCVSVYTEPGLVEIGGLRFLLVPYREGVSMGAAIADISETLPRGRWVLVGHGDLHGGSAEVNPYEPGTYMPLSMQDIRRFTPWRVLLGHIHKPMDDGRVHYPGSPCGLDITEEGRRRFLVLDTDTGEVESRTLRTAVLYLREEFLVLPGDEEIARLQRDIRDRISTWGIEPGERDRVRLRVSVRGYSSDRSRVGEVLSEGFRGFRTYRDEGMDLSRLYASDDVQLNAVAERTRQIVEALEWPWGGREPERPAVMEAVLRVIYGTEVS